MTDPVASFSHDTDSPEATSRAGRALGAVVEPGDVIGLVGELGAGKTLLVQALASGLGVPADVRVTSPTFTLINLYRGGRVALVHADLYRIESDAELDAIGLDDLWRTDAVVAVEWSDRYAVLPPDHLTVRIEASDGRARRITAVPSGPRSAKLADRWRAGLVM